MAPTRYIDITTERSYDNIQKEVRDIKKQEIVMGKTMEGIGVTMVIETERLVINIASDDEMRVLVETETDPEMKAAYQEMLDGCLAHADKREWNAVWFIRLVTGECVGDYCFKGLGQDGMVEIGYGLHPEYWGKGYAAEAIKAAVQWALKQPGVTRVEAETDPGNKASQRVLEKTGFIPTGTYGEEGPRFVISGI